MNIKRELQTMSITDLRSICRDLGVSCPKTKSGIIKRLLFPLKKGYNTNTTINSDSSQNEINAVLEQVTGIIIAPNQNNNMTNQNNNNQNNNMTNQNNNMTNQNNNTTNQNNNPSRSSEG